MGGNTPCFVFASCQIICYMLIVLVFTRLAGFPCPDCVALVFFALVLAWDVPLAAAAEVATWAVRDLVPYCV